MFGKNTAPTFSDVLLTMNSELENVKNFTDEALVEEVEYFCKFVQFTEDISKVCEKFQATKILTPEDRLFLEQTYAFSQAPLCISEAGTVKGGYFE